jgi:hypothetical protein
LGYIKGVGDGPLRPKGLPNVISKRKKPMLPFHPDKPKNPLEALDRAKKFKVVHSNLKRRIKQEDPENDPTESSGAEVHGDSDYRLPTDADE